MLSRERAPSSVMTSEPGVLPLSVERGPSLVFSPNSERSPRVLLPVLGQEQDEGEGLRRDAESLEIMKIRHA